MLLRAACFDVSFILQLNFLFIFFLCCMKISCWESCLFQRSCPDHILWLAVQIATLQVDINCVLKVHVYGFVTTFQFIFTLVWWLTKHMLHALWCHEQLPAAVQFTETNLPFDFLQSSIYFLRHTWLTTFFSGFI